MGVRAAITLKRALRCSALLVVLTFGSAVALAEPVQQFDVQLKDITPDGRYSVVFTSNSFDTTGGPPTALADASLRLPKGIAIKPAFLKPARLCDSGRLKGILTNTARPGLSYAQILVNLAGARKRIAGRLTPGGRKIYDTCLKALFGSGTATIDARPQYSASAVPGRFYLFLSRPTVKGAIAAIGVLSIYDGRNSPVPPKDVLVRSLQSSFMVNVFNDPTPDGLYGYRVKLLPERVGNLTLSVAELRVESKGLVGPSRKRGTREFWATQPKCPASGKLRFKGEYRYSNGVSTSNVVQVPCPRFRR